VPSSAATFLAVVLAHVDVADEALASVRALEDQPDVSVRDAAVVVRTELGRIELQQTREIAAGEGIVGGGAAGVIAGLLLGFPVGGALLGLAGGAAFGLRDRGIPDGRLRKLGQDLEPGQAVLCVLVEPNGVATTREALSSYGTVFDAELSSGSDS
jgi:uncharacterized membrane protein